jgi:hypothetical protein
MRIKKLKVTKHYGGGGGQQATTPTIPEWARPYLENVGDQAQALYGSGQLSKVAGATANQNKAFGAGANAIATSTGAGMDTLADQQKRLTAAATSGGYDTTALKDKAILEAEGKTAALGTQYGAGGTLGSARQAVAQGAQNAATSAQFATLDRDAAQQGFTNRMTAESGLGSSVGAGASLATNAASSLAKLGSEERTINQQQADAPWQALQRYASTIYGNPARQQQTSGGK